VDVYTKYGLGLFDKTSPAVNVILGMGVTLFTNKIQQMVAKSIFSGSGGMIFIVI
jgi:hypothetical protein